VVSSTSREESEEMYSGNVFGPGEFLRKQIEAEGGKVERR
jgi:hypothetical protein